MRPSNALKHTGGALSLALFVTGSAAYAQDEREDRGPRRVRVALGPQLVPSFPGSDSVSVRPLIDLAFARGDDPFPFEAPDEGAGPVVVTSNAWQFGPAIGPEGKRSRSDTDGLLPKVGFTFELGGFVQYQLAPPIRLRTEFRQGIGGHKGLIGTISADYVARDGDQWLFSIGPRATFANGRYNRAYFGIDPQTATASGLPAYKADGGLQAVGATTGFLYQLTPRWGVYSYAKYDRLVADTGRSPVVRSFGSRNQLSGGVALSFTFR
jgi:outer membrane protein